MDNFLTKLFAEEQEKVASAELGQFMHQLSTDDLEDFLGIRKVAVEGKPEPSLPDSLPTGKLEALQQQKRDYVDQEHSGTPKKVGSQPEGAQTGVKHEGPGKEATGKTAEDAATEKVAWADRCGRLFAKQAACAMTKTDEFTNPAAKAKAKAFSATLKASKGQPLATRKAALQGTEKAIEKKGGLSDLVMQHPALARTLIGTGLGAGVGAGVGALRAESGERGMGALRGAGIGGLVGGGAAGGAELGNIAVRPLLRRAVERESTPALFGAMAGGAGLGTAAGGVGGALLAKKLLGRAEPQEKESMGMPESEGAGMESVASVKAKIAAKALKVSAGAPEHIKAAAVFLAGREIAKLAR